MLSRLFGARSQGAEPYDFQWRTHPDNPDLVAASHGPWFRNTTVGDPADYAHEFYLLGVNARLAVASHFELLPKVGQAEARASLDHLHARLEDSLLLVARIGAFAGDRGLIRQFQRMIGAYRTLLLHDFAGLGGNASPEASRQAIEQLLPFGEGSREVVLPLMVRQEDIKALALIELAEAADEIYDGFEPQLIDHGHERGYRVIAYRHDGYVDWYDDPALTIDPTESSSVTRQGMNSHVNTDLGGTVIEVDEHGRARIVVEFTDIQGRQVVIRIQETATRPSVPTSLLAPIGWSSVEPTAFPLFVMPHFEFIRAGSEVVAAIGGNPVELAPFPAPVPLQGQSRLGSKYSLEPQIMELFPTKPTQLQRVVTQPGTDLFETDGVRYLFTGDALESILINETEITFSPALDVTKSAVGRFEVRSYPWHGTISGAFQVEAKGTQSRLTLDVDDVVVPHQRDLVYRLIVNERTFFGKWPKAYRYEATIDTAAGTISASWFNDDPRSPEPA